MTSEHYWSAGHLSVVPVRLGTPGACLHLLVPFSQEDARMQSVTQTMGYCDLDGEQARGAASLDAVTTSDFQLGGF